MDTLDIRVCPDCGAPAGQQPFCGRCGLNLTSQERLPTRRQWEADRSTTSPETPPSASPAEMFSVPEATRPATRRGSSESEPISADDDVSPQPLFFPQGDPEFQGRPLANWGYRVGGWLIDVGTVLSVALGAGLAAHGLGATVDSSEAITGAALFPLWLLNVVVLVGITRGRSLGKLVGGMRIVRHDGCPARFGTGLLRDVLARVIYLVPLGFLADSLWAVGDARQTLRDKMVRTHVVQEPSYTRRVRAITLGATAAIGATVALAAASPDSLGSADDDYSSFDRQVFVDGCSTGDGGLARGRCGCVFDYIRDRVPYADYAEADRTEDLDQWPANVRDAMSEGVARC